MNILLMMFIFLLFSIEGWSQELVKDGLQPIIEEIHKQIQKEKSTLNNGIPFIIAIGGCPGVGKSTMTKLLQIELAELNIVSVIISLDHYGLSQEERKQFAKELDPRRIQWDKIHNTLTSIQKGETQIVKPTIDQLSKKIGEETLNLVNVDCIFFEGCYTLGDFSPMDFLQYVDLALYLETSLENIYDWKWLRELAKTSPRTSQEFFHHMTSILEDFAFHVYPTRKNADNIIQIDSSHRYLITKEETAKTRLTPNFTSVRLETFIVDSSQK